MKKIYKYDLDIEELALIADTLDNTELGIFMRLEWYYIRLGCLPTDKKELYSLCRAKNNKLQQATDRVVAKFNSTESLKRLDKERSRILKKKEDCSGAGKESAQRRTQNEICAEPKNDSGNLANHRENNDSHSTDVQPPTTTTIKKEEIDKSISSKKEEPPPKKEKDYSEEFEQFWQEFPKTHDPKKKLAFKKYNISLKKHGVDHGVLLKSAGDFRRFCELRGKSPEFITRAHNWLENELWVTDYAAQIDNFKKVEVSHAANQQHNPPRRESASDFKARLLAEYDAAAAAVGCLLVEDQNGAMLRAN